MIRDTNSTIARLFRTSGNVEREDGGGTPREDGGASYVIRFSFSVGVKGQCAFIR